MDHYGSLSANFLEQQRINVMHYVPRHNKVYVHYCYGYSRLHIGFLKVDSNMTMPAVLDLKEDVIQLASSALLRAPVSRLHRNSVGQDTHLSSRHQHRVISSHMTPPLLRQGDTRVDRRVHVAVYSSDRYSVASPKV